MNEDTAWSTNDERQFLSNAVSKIADVQEKRKFIMNYAEGLDYRHLSFTGPTPIGGEELADIVSHLYVLYENTRRANV